jgi:phenylacetate-CoA ligase
MSASDAFYAGLPVWAQHAATTVYGIYWHHLRFGPGFNRYVQEYKESEMFSKEQWQDLQTVQIHRLLADCIEHVPFYRENWTGDQKRAALNGNLSALPLLEKPPLRESPQSFLREDLHPFCPQIFLTSGSTGTPISSYYTIPELRKSIALREVRSASWAGVSFFTRGYRPSIRCRLAAP